MDQTTSTAPRKQRVSRYVTTTVEVEVDIAEYLDESEDSELSELGLHRADSCAGDPDGSADELYQALNALHQQAHPDQPLFVDTCLREPCRGLSARRFPNLR
ncbi:hypothetical protein [Streptomyces sp. sk2.1]|uniref:hypothetical protein n=1 Tax=Streptomyces sp. sk2.1 TaxID=2478959 RepID=UPI0011E6C711|nr:hypothetical protein [Streptomyces sp. sk2.1]TXS78657.1 hypothetical protein EAO76_09865 [Streptomyces sp. sk2.1]